MRTILLLTLLATASLWGCTEPTTEYYKNRTTLDRVCTELKVDCSQVETPTVVISKVVPDIYYGMYFPGERYIFIGYGIPKPYIDVEIHETTHYVLYELFGNIGNCVSERYAREVTAALTATLVDPTWEERYGCAQSQ